PHRDNRRRAARHRGSSRANGRWNSRRRRRRATFARRAGGLRRRPPDSDVHGSRRRRCQGSCDDHGLGFSCNELPRVRGGVRAVRVIAIDGPSGSGKSTVAKAVAERLGLDYLDTGAMYRAVAFAAIRRGIDPDDADSVAELARQVDLSVGDTVVVDGADATIEIRSPEVT